MNPYVTGAAVKQLREKRNLTQAELADRIGVSAKTVSKWETAKGLPDVSLLEPLAKALNISVIELMNGEQITNRNVSANMLRSKFYVCPVCGNVVYSIGKAAVSCCGIMLSQMEAEDTDEEHTISIETVEDEYFITVQHPMEKDHYISYAAWVTGDRVQIVKFYPEGNAQTRMQLRGSGCIYIYCNRHGLMRARVYKGKIK